MFCQQLAVGPEHAARVVQLVRAALRDGSADKRHVRCSRGVCQGGHGLETHDDWDQQKQMLRSAELKH